MRLDAGTVRTKTRTPCFKCENRAVGCHSTCKEYQAWVEEYQAKKSEIQAEKAKQDDIEGYNVTRSMKSRKAHMRLKQYFGDK